MTSKQIIKLAKIGLAVLQKTAGRIPGVPDGSGPHGRRGGGRGPGQGTRSGLGIIRQKMNNGKRLTKTEQDIYNKYHPDMGKNSGLAPGVPDETGPYGRGAGPGQGTGSGLGMIQSYLDTIGPAFSGIGNSGEYEGEARPVRNKALTSALQDLIAMATSRKASKTEDILGILDALSETGLEVGGDDLANYFKSQIDPQLQKAIDTRQQAFRKELGGLINNVAPEEFKKLLSEFNTRYPDPYKEATAKTASKMTNEQIIKLAKIGFVVLSKQTELQKTASNKKLITAIAAVLGLGGASAYAATGDRPGAIGDWADEAIKDSTRWGEGAALDANQWGTNAIDDITKLFGGGRNEEDRARDNAVQDIQQWLHSGCGNVEDLLD